MRRGSPEGGAVSSLSDFASSPVCWSHAARILLIKPSSLGDIVHTLPVVSAIKQHRPDVHITWVVKRQWAELVERVGGVDRVWPVAPTVRGWIAAGFELRAERFDLAIDVQGLFRSGLLARLSGAPIRIGFANGREGSPVFYTHRVTVPTPDMHAVNRYLSVLTVVGVSLPKKPQFEFRFPEEDMAQVRGVCQRQGLLLDRPWIAMNVGARWPTKRWPLTSFAAVVDQLYESRFAQVALIGSADDRQLGESLRTLTKHSFIDLCGEIPLKCLPALLSTATAMITNDSGPMHIAAALRIPVIALFGPTSAARTGPYGDGHQVLSARIPCSPCFSRICRHEPHLECLQLITPAHVGGVIRPLVEAHVSCR